MEELREETYWWSLELVRGGRQVEGAILLLATWNFAGFRYAMTTFDLKAFRQAIEYFDSKFFASERFETVNLAKERVAKRVKQSYERLSAIKGVKHVGASKVMHLLAPEVFVPWDGRIISHYKARRTPEGYVDFMTRMQAKYRNGAFLGLERILRARKSTRKVTLPRAIDMWNMRTVHGPTLAH